MSCKNGGLEGSRLDFGGPRVRFWRIWGMFLGMLPRSSPSSNPSSNSSSNPCQWTLILNLFWVPQTMRFPLIVLCFFRFLLQLQVHHWVQTEESSSLRFVGLDQNFLGICESFDLGSWNFSVGTIDQKGTDPRIKSKVSQEMITVTKTELHCDPRHFVLGASRRRRWMAEPLN